MFQLDYFLESQDLEKHLFEADFEGLMQNYLVQALLGVERLALQAMV